MAKKTTKTEEKAPKAEEPEAPAGPSSLSETQAAVVEEMDENPGLAGIAAMTSTGEGLASDLRGGDVKTEPDKSADWGDAGGQEYHAGPEQPSDK